MGLHDTARTAAGHSSQCADGTITRIGRRVLFSIWLACVWFNAAAADMIRFVV